MSEPNTGLCLNQQEDARRGLSFPDSETTACLETILPAITIGFWMGQTECVTVRATLTRA